nr:glycosyltransferase [uncultured Chryseobacterium sp.]
MRENISVCMASYNGSLYIEEQICSIVNQLIPGDELIIIDDCSTDHTLEIVKNIKSHYIKVFKNDKNIGHVKTFEKSFSFAENRFICLADQDDIWIEGRLQALYDVLEQKDVLMVASNFQIHNDYNKNINFFRLKKNNSNDSLKNIFKIFRGKSAYYGCTMMIRRELLKYIMPFPSYIEAHDLWMAISANVLKSIYHFEDNTLIYRVHNNNSSLKKRKLIQKLKARYYFCKNILTILKRINK